MTVVHPNHITGINSITVATGEALSVHKNDGSLIRTIVSNTGISTFHAIEVSKGGGDLTVGVSTFFVDNSAGRVGVGTAIPDTEFHVYDGNSLLVSLFESETHDSRLRIKAPSTKYSQIEFADDDADTGEIRYDHTDDSMQFFVNANDEKLRIDSSGRILQGKTSTKGSTGENVPTFCNEVASVNPNVFEIANNGTNANSYSALVLSRSDGSSVNDHTAVDSGDKIGEVCFIGADGADRFNTAASIHVEAGADFTANDCPANLIFSTNAGAASATERLRITSAGTVAIGGDYTQTTNALYVQGNPGIKVQGGTGGGGIANLLELKHPNTSSSAGDGDGPSMLFNGYYSSAEWAFAKVCSVNSGSGYGADFQIHVHPANGSQGASLVKALSIVGDGTSGANVTITNGDLEVAGICTAAAFAPAAGQLSHRNLIVNGAMQVAQRATSYTSSSQGYQTVDRITASWSGLDNNIEQHQGTLSSSDGTPYNLGFRNTYKVVNGNQTGGAGASDYIQIEHRLEAQDVANSGWNYKSASSYITLSFWIKASVSQDYTVNLTTTDGTSYRYPMKTGTISANTWTKITKTIPGNSNLDINNDNGKGLTIMWYPYLGNSYVGGSSINAWSTANVSNFGGSSDTSWYTTDDATWEITGVQLEVGEHATPFEHRRFGEELIKCYRYCQKYHSAGSTYRFICQGNVDNDGDNLAMLLEFIQEFRDAPSMITTGSASDYAVRRDTTQTCTSVPVAGSTSTMSTGITFVKTSHGWSTGQSVKAFFKTGSSYLIFDAEL